MTMPRVLIGPYLLRNQPGRFRQILTEGGFDPVDPDGDFALTTEQLRPHLASIHAMMAGGERMTPDLFKEAPNLRVIARTGVGYDLIDVDAATAHRVAVTITPGTNQESVAEQTWASSWRWPGGSCPTTGSFTAAAGTGPWSLRSAE